MSCYVPAGEDQQYEQDIEKAKQLLKEAGYENGFDLELVCNESQGRITMAEMLANAWNAIGVKTELRTLEFSALVDLVYSGETQAFLLGFLPGGNDGEFYRTLFQTGRRKRRLDKLLQPRGGRALRPRLQGDGQREAQRVLRRAPDHPARRNALAVDTLHRQRLRHAEDPDRT